MQEPITLTDAELDSVLNSDKPALILVTNGDGLRGDVKVEFKKAAAAHDDIVFAQVDPTKNPRAAEVFQAGSKPVMVAWHCGETISRRNRPWGTDVGAAIELLENALQAANPAPENDGDSSESDTDKKDKKPVTTIIPNDEPLKVTDQSFQQDAIDYSDEMPVLIDFWAEWCGPCRMVAPVLDKLAKEYAGKIRIVKVNVDENPALSQTFQIQSIPTMMAIKQRTIIFSQPGALPEPNMRELVDKIIEFEIPAEVLEEQRKRMAEAEAEAQGDNPDA